MTVVAILLGAFLVYAVFWTAYIVSSPVLLFFRQNPNSPNAATCVPTCWVVIPAHAAEKEIGGCIEACIKSSGVKVAKVVVIADHCSDDTAKVALEAGAEVCERNSGPRGKTFALDWYFEQCFHPLISACPIVITDATARVELDALAKVVYPLTTGYDAAVGTAKVVPGQHEWLHIGGALSLQHRSIQNRCRAAFGYNPLIEGRLMAFSSRYLNSYRWQLARPPPELNLVSHPTEDWRHGLRLAQENIEVAYVEDAVVQTPLRISATAGGAQARRWDAGRRFNAKTLGLPLLIDAIRSKRQTLLIACLDALQPPQIEVVAIGAMLTLVGAVMNLVQIFFGGLMVLSVFIAYYGGLIVFSGEANANLSVIKMCRWVIWRTSTLINKDTDK